MTGRRIAAGLALVALAGGALFVAYAWDYWRAAEVLGVDLRLNLDFTRRWIETGQPYLPYQLAGPYVVGDHVGADSPIMYPPPVLLLFAPFLVLPAILWWAIPIGLTAWAVYQHHPRPLVWPVLALLVAFPQTLWFVATGNPLLWFVAALALATVGGPWAVLLVLKPTLGPFALFGIWRRSWWLGLGALAVVSLAFLPLWDDWRLVLLNALGGNGPLYNLNQYPALMIPIMAWLGSARFAQKKTDEIVANTLDRHTTVA